MINLKDLRLIEATDPDGGHKEPTDIDYAHHKEWAIANFGAETWKVYAKGGWGDSGTDGDDYFPDGNDYEY